MEDSRYEARKVQVQGEPGTSYARKQRRAQSLMGQCQKDPGASMKCHLLIKFGEILASKRKMMLMDYNTLNLKKRDYKFMVI